jgi:ribosome-binding protein aMBF1 (putative translation factor)
MAEIDLKPKFIEIKSGKRIVVLEEEEYNRLVDAVDAAEAARILADASDPEVDWSEAVRELTNNRIADVRKSKGISQRKLAEKLKVKPSTLSRWERQDANLTLDTLRKVAKALGCSIHVLIS